MGCDIHAYVEKRVDGKWEFVPPVGAPSSGFTLEYEGTPDEYRHICDWDIGRNYSLFAILAGVRNGSGFAGCDTGNPVVPISEPREVPEDASDLYKEAVKSWGGDGHSHSYLSLAEILSFDWTQLQTHRGIIDWIIWKKWEEEKKFSWNQSKYLQPESWCGGISGPGIIILNREEALAKLQNEPWNREVDSDLFHRAKGNMAAAPEDPNALIHVRDEWSTPFYQSAKSFWSEIIPQLCALGPNHEDIRLVFFFDN